MFMLNPDEPGQQADTKANQRNTDYNSQEDWIARNLSPEFSHPAHSSSHKRRNVCNKSFQSGHLTFYKNHSLKISLYIITALASVMTNYFLPLTSDSSIKLNCFEGSCSDSSILSKAPFWVK